jgi:hypothetical protein
MATPLPILSDVTQQFIDLQSKLEKLVPSLGGVVKALSSLTEGFDSLASGADKATSSLEKAATGLEKLAEAADGLEKLTANAKKLGEVSSKSSGLQPSILSQAGSFLKGLPGRATAPGMSDAISSWSAPLGYAKSAKEAMDARSKAPDGPNGGAGPEVPWSFTTAQESMERFDASLKSVQMSLLTGLAPALGVAGDMMTSVMDAVRPLTDLLSENQGTVELLATVLLPMAGTLYILAKAIEVVAFVTEMWTAAQTLLNVVLIDNPIGAIIMAVVAVAGAIAYAYTHFEKFRGAVVGTMDVVKLLFDYCETVYNLLSKIGEAMRHPLNLLDEDFRKSIGGLVSHLKSLPGIGVTFTQGSEGAIQKMRAEKDYEQQMKRLDKPFSLEDHARDEKNWEDALKNPKQGLGEWPSAASIGVGSPGARTTGAGRATTAGHHITINIRELGTTTFHVESIDKKHALAMREHVREALVAALQDATAPSPALA